MELFERVKQVRKVAKSYARISQALGITQSNFNYYCDVKTQDNFWPLLPKLLDAFPQLSRDWLYFGEGAMVMPEINGASVQDTLARQAALIEELQDTQRQLALAMQKDKNI